MAELYDGPFTYTSPSNSETSDSPFAMDRNDFFPQTILTLGQDVTDDPNTPPSAPREKGAVLPLRIPTREGIRWDLLVDIQAAKQYQCKLCGKLVRNAVQLMCSMHRRLNSEYLYCEDCFIAYTAAHQNICPLIDRPQPHYATYQPAINIRIAVNNLIVICPHSYRSNDNEVRGCKWRGKLSEFQIHVSQQCTHKELPCEFYAYGCQIAVTTKTILHHKQEFMAQHLDMLKDKLGYVTTTQHDLILSLKMKDEQISALTKNVQGLTDKLRSAINEVLKVKQKLFSLETRLPSPASTPLPTIALPMTAPHCTNSLIRGGTTAFPDISTMLDRHSISGAPSQLARSPMVVSGSEEKERSVSPSMSAQLYPTSVGSDSDSENAMNRATTAPTEAKLTRKKPRSNSAEDLSRLVISPFKSYWTHWSELCKSAAIEISAGPNCAGDNKGTSPNTRAICYSENKTVRATHALPQNSALPLEWKLVFTEAEMDCGFFIGVVSDQTTNFETCALKGNLVDAYGISDVDGNVYMNGDKIERCEWKPPIYSGDVITVCFDSRHLRLLFALNDIPMLCDNSKEETNDADDLNPVMPYSIQLPQSSTDKLWFPTISFGKFWGNQFIAADISFS